MRRAMRVSVAAVLLLALHTVPGLAQEKKKKLLETTGWGSLSGKVTLEGDFPAPVPLAAAVAGNANAVCCKAAAPRFAENWVIDKKTKGIANVFVWIKPPVGTYFPIQAADKVRKNTVTMDQPDCVYEPHAVVLFPEYFDGAKMVPTGQKFVVKNGAKCAHSVRTSPDPKIDIAQNFNLPPDAQRECEFKPQRYPIQIDCAFHGWMNAYVGVYDHPYHALTQADGSFTMPRVPAGAEVTIMAWHEVVVLNALAIKGKAITLKAGENKFDFAIKAK
jgi:hypothetical protein